MASDPATQPADPHDAAQAGRERAAAFRAGVRAISPALIATGTWALVTGVAMVKSGLTESMALAMTLLLYAGSAQLTSLPLIATGAPLWLIFAAGCVVNLRFVIFGAALHPYFRHLSWPKRLGLGYFTTDMGFVLFMPRYADAPVRGTREQLWFFMGTIVPGWLVWQSFSIVGIYLGVMVPSSWSLDFAAVLALLAITVPLANSRPMLVSMLAAGVVAWVGQALPLRLGLAAAVVAGIVAGMLAERYLPGRT
ncbi:AzlC family ABC transporter permease [Bordetella sp. 2513F-2]